MTTDIAARENVDVLGTTALVLLQDGNRQAAALLRDVESSSFDLYDSYRGRVELRVPYWMVERFTPEILEQITNAWTEVDPPDNYSLEVTVARSLPNPEGWREQIDQEVENPTPTNQAQLAPRSANVIKVDGLYFRSEAERAVYLALQVRQEELSSRNGAETFLIIPNMAVRLPDHTWEIDFIVCYRGRCGAIEIDGARHRGKAADDRTRDQLLEDAGMSYVTRIPAEATRDSTELQGHIDRFLRKLQG